MPNTKKLEKQRGTQTLSMGKTIDDSELKRNKAVGNMRLMAPNEMKDVPGRKSLPPKELTEQTKRAFFQRAGKSIREIRNINRSAEELVEAQAQVNGQVEAQDQVHVEVEAQDQVQINGQVEAQAQNQEQVNGQVEVEAQDQVQINGQVEAQAQNQEQVNGQVEVEAQDQVQINGQVEAQAQNQEQVNGQVEAQGQAQVNGQRELTDREKARQKMESFHKKVEALNAKYFGNQKVKKTKFENLSEKKKNQRTDLALQREANRDKLDQYEKENGGGSVESPQKIQSIDEFEVVLKNFLKLSGEALDMDTDENFIRNLKANYVLASVGETMRKAIIDATDGGYLPETIDMEAVQTKIARFTDLKNYLDVRRKIMTNPYYIYFKEGEDYLYNDKQLDSLSLKVHQGEDRDLTFYNYLENVKVLREMNLNAKKGLSSIANRTKQRGKHEKIMMRERAQKREVSAKLTEYVMHYRGDQRFQDKNYDDIYDRDLYERKLNEFADLDLHSLHFANAMDMADYAGVNEQIFAQAREIEHLLSIAVRKNDSDLTDATMIAVRAKIRTIHRVEQIVASVTKYMVTHAEEAVNDLTFDEIVKNCSDEKEEIFDGVASPAFGTDMVKFYEKIRRSYQKEHNNREKTICRMYQLMHPQVSERRISPEDADYDEVEEDRMDGDIKVVKEYRPGEISAEELQKRMREYQQNCVINDYVINTENYMDKVWLSQSETVKAIYEQKYHVDPQKLLGPNRSMRRFHTGMSGEEMVRLLDRMRTASDAQRQEYLKSVVDEAVSIDFREMDEKEHTDQLLDNLAYKHAVQGVFANIDELGGSEETPLITDPKYRKLVRAYARIGSGHASQISLIAQRMYRGINGKYGHAMVLDDILHNTSDSLGFYKQIENYFEFEGRTSYKVDGHTFLDSKEADELSESLIGATHFQNNATAPLENTVYGKQYRNTPEVSRYQELKRQGLWKDTTAQELKDLQGHYKLFFSEGNPVIAQIREEFGSVLELKSGTAKEEKQNVERLCSAIYDNVMGLDLTQFTFESYMDFIKGPQVKGEDGKLREATPEENYARFLKLYRTVEFADLLSSKIDRANNDPLYGDYQLEEKLKAVLTGEDLKEIKARCDLIKQAKKFFSPEFAEVLQSPLLSKFSLDEMLHLPPDYYRDMQKEGGKFSRYDIDKVADFVRKREGYDIFAPLKNLEGRVRRDAGLSGDKDRPKVIANALNKKPLVFEELEIGGIGALECKVQSSRLLEHAFGERFDELTMTEEQRNQAILDQNTIQGIKRRVGETIYEKQHNYLDKLYRKKKGVSIANCVKVGEARLMDIIALSGRRSVLNEQDKSKHKNRDIDVLVEMYAKGGADRFACLQELTFNFLDLRIFSDITTNAWFAANTEKLEELTRIAYAYRNILKDNPDFLEALQNKEAGKTESQYQIVINRLNQMLAISDYYRARKLLLTNHYYLRHDNMEMGANYEKSMTAEQRCVVDLIKLTNRLSDRIVNKEFAARNADSIEHLLIEYEHKAMFQGALNGRVDLNKANVSYAQNVKDQVDEFLEKAGLTTKDKIFNFNPTTAPADVAALYTEEVKNYLDAFRMHHNMYESGMISQREKDLKIRLEGMTKYQTDKKDAEGNPKMVVIGSFELKDPKTGEVWRFGSGASRTAKLIAAVFHGTASDEEIADIMDGLTIGQRGGLDLYDEAQMAYAKERWLAAAKKLFDLEYAAIKSVEQTYGTMVEDLPPAVFMCTLGSGQKDYVKKSRMAQDVTELCAEQFCDFGGKKLSLGELLAEHGLVRADEVADMVKLSPNYYMKNFNHLQAYYENPVNDDPLYTLNENEMVKIRYERNRYVYGGPQLSRARRRKIWKDAMETRDVHFLPTDQVIRYHRDNLNIYTKKELKDLRAQRAKDNASAEKAERGYDRNLETVYNWAMEYITQNAGVKLSEETRSEIKRLMAFHPLLYRKVDEDKLRRDPVKKAENHERNVSFYKKVMEFCGIGVPEEEKAKKKAEIFAYFRNTAETLLAAVGIERAEDFGWLESGKEEDALASGNAFALLEARHHMFDTLQYYTGKPDAEDWLSVEEEKDFRRALKKQIRFEVYRKTLRANYYVNLKDLGGRHDTGVGRDYLTLQYLGQYMSIGELTNIDFDRDILGNPEYVRVLAEYGIRFTSSTPINRPKAEAEKRRAEEEANRLAEQMADRESIKRRGEPDGGV